MSGDDHKQKEARSLVGRYQGPCAPHLRSELSFFTKVESSHFTKVEPGSRDKLPEKEGR